MSSAAPQQKHSAGAGPRPAGAGAGKPHGNHAPGAGAGGGQRSHSAGHQHTDKKHHAAGASHAAPQAEPAPRPKVIAGIAFGMLSGTEMARAAELQICSRELYRMPSRAPAQYGVLDPHLGVSDKNSSCQTCGKGLQDCAGHWGYIALELPVYHIGFLKATIVVLQNICKCCSRVLLDGDERKSMLRTMRDPRTDALKRARVRRRITEMTKKVGCCPWCGAVNGPVKKINAATCFRIVHDKYRWEKTRTGGEGAKESFGELFASATSSDPAVGPLIQRSLEEISPLKARDLFRAIPDADLDLLWHDRERGRPENMIMSNVMVPPVAIRPSVAMDAGGGSNEDDVTIKLQEIVHINSALRLALEKGASAKMVQEDWDFLQVLVATLINGELPGMPPALKPRRPIRALAQRLKGKQGRFRGNLSGKRVDFSGRTVISPDPNLPIHCVGVPIHVAKILTFPERVTALNLTRLQGMVSNGPEYPGANTIRLSNGMIKNLQYGDRAKAAQQLRIGDVVERHLIDGDAVLFNRQPSLHKMSIMCHRVRVLAGRTFRFNECVCTPYNADFDGDEMNLHLPQTEEARAEAALLMDVRENLITSRSGEPLIAAHQDFITASWLITQRDVLLDRDQFCQAVATLGDGAEHIDLPAPAILKPGPFWTGKQVINMLLKPNKSISLKASFECKARNYSKKGEVMCPNDGYVMVRDGVLLAGNLDKEIIGNGSKKGLVYVLIRDNSGPVAARALLRFTKMTARWLMNWGFSIGIEDVSPSAKLSSKKQIGMAEGYAKANQLVEQFRAGTLALQPGCNEEQSLEALMNGTLSKLRESMGNMCMDELHRLNPPRVMAVCGSKGSTLNISQMVACVGQQSVGGARIQEGFVERTLPIFPAKAKDPAAKGFVANSFYTGLSATEFFFHTMGGREGLVDTAVKTADTGYMQRRMMKTLEDLCVAYDGSVRTSNGDMVQTRYGDDGLDPAYMEATGRPADFQRTLLQARFGGKDDKAFSAVAPITERIVADDGASAAAPAPVPVKGGRGAKKSASAANAVVDSSAPSTASTASSVAAQAVEAEVALTPAEIRAMVAQRLAPSALGDLGGGGSSGRGNASAASASASASSSSGAGAAAATAGAQPSADGAAFFASVRDFFDKDVAGAVEHRMQEVGLGHLLDGSAAAASGTAMEEAGAGAGAGKSSAAGRKCRGAAGAGKAALAASMPPAGAPSADAASSSGPLLKVDADILASHKAALQFAKSSDPSSKRTEAAAIVARTSGVTGAQLARALDMIISKYKRAVMQPGEAVGAVAAHSLGEPATQMTLKTFHFAGVASMNVTLGVPRIKELMNAARAISTPIIEAALENGDSEITARIVKARIEKTTLGDIAESIAEVYAPDGAHLEVVLDLEAIAALRLEHVTARSVAASLVRAPKMHLKDSNVRVAGDDRVQVYPPSRKSASRVRAERQRARELVKEKERIAMEGKGGEAEASATAAAAGAGRGGDDDDDDEVDNNGSANEDDDDIDEEMLGQYTAAASAGMRSDSYFSLQALKASIPSVIVQGIPTVNRAVITKSDGTSTAGSGKGSPAGAYKLLVEGYDLLRVMGTPGVRGTATTSNHIIEVEETLGIEAARVMIQAELARTYGSYGIVVDGRHLRLLADVMTYKGNVLGVTRFGIAKMKDSVLMLASFEKTPDHLFDAAVHSRVDPCVGVSESIIVGTPIPLGTGLFSILEKDETSGENVVVGGAAPAYAQHAKEQASRTNDHWAPSRAANGGMRVSFAPLPLPSVV